MKSWLGMEQNFRCQNICWRKYLKLVIDVVDLYATKFCKVYYYGLTYSFDVKHLEKVGIEQPHLHLLHHEIIQYLISTLLCISQLFSQPQSAPGTLKGNI